MAPVFPGHYQRRISLPKIPGKNSKGWDKVQTDDELVSASSPEQKLTIIGDNGISVTGDITTDTITIDYTAETSWKSDEFTPILDQVSFTLSESPDQESSVFFIVNGVIYDDDDDFAVSGQTITWTNALFNFENGDKVIVKYI